MTAEDYKATLPKGKGGTSWTMETFSTYVHLLYPNISVIYGQEWNTTQGTYWVSCSKPGHKPFKAQGGHMLTLNGNSHCRQCYQEKCSASGGKRRNKRATPQEKENAIHRYYECNNYSQVAREFNRTVFAIRSWVRPEVRQMNIEKAELWNEANPGRRKELDARHYSLNGYLQRIQEFPESVLVDGEWCETDPTITYDYYREVLYTDEMITAITNLYTESRTLTKETGIKHEIDHIIPLSKGGEHLPFNLQVITESENQQKNNTLRDEDKKLICRRLFT